MRSRRGFNLVEGIVVVAILGFFVLVLLTTLPRRREVARRATCQKNLSQIGVALALYDRSEGHLPMVPALGAGEASPGTGPLKALLEALGLADLKGVDDPARPPARQPGAVPGERLVPDFVCPSDVNATAAEFPAPVNYRATTGDTADGRGGPFTPGRRTSLAEIEAGDGTGYTAAFSERLIGTGRPVVSPANYADVPGPLGDGGCPAADPSSWKGDAGWTWTAAEWRSTLYSHALRPGAAPSCIAGDGRSALMGASSAHPGTVNVLTFDGSVKAYTSTVDPTIWRKLATSGPAEAAQRP